MRKVTLRSVWHLYITTDQYGNRLYTVANVYQIFRNRRYTKISSNNYQNIFAMYLPASNDILDCNTVKNRNKPCVWLKGKLKKKVM